MPLLPFASAPGKSTLIIGTTPISGGTSGRVLYDNAGVVGEMTTTGSGTVLVLATGPTLTGPVTITEVAGSSGLTITGATQTVSFPALTITQTWNASGVAFTGLLLNITSTASAAASLVLDLQVSGTSVLNITKAGVVTTTANGSAGAFVVAVSGQAVVGIGRNSSVAGLNLYGNGTSTPLVLIGSGASSAVLLDSTAAIGFSSGSVTQNMDAILRRAAAATFQMGVDVNGAAINQQLQACNGITGTDKAGAVLTVSAGLGTGAGTPTSLVLASSSVTTTGTTAQTRLTGMIVKLGTAILTSYIVSGLPSASTVGAGATAFVTDSSTTVILGLGVTVVGGGSNKVPVYSDGTNWIIG